MRFFVYDSPAKPAVRNQVGSSVAPGKNSGTGQQPDAQRFAAAAVDEVEVSTPKQQWTQTKGAGRWYGYQFLHDECR